MNKHPIMRLTTDNPQDNVENMFNIAFVKDKQVWMRYCGKDDQDCTLVSFIKQICCNINGAKCCFALKTDDVKDFSDMMFECAVGQLCPIANVYFGLVQAAELRERLKEYEDALPFEQAKELSKTDADINRSINHVLSLEELNGRTDPVWVYVPDSPLCLDGGYYSLCDHGNILPPSGLSFKAGERNWTFLDHRPTTVKRMEDKQAEAATKQE